MRLFRRLADSLDVGTVQAGAALPAPHPTPVRFRRAVAATVVAVLTAAATLPVLAHDPVDEDGVAVEHAPHCVSDLTTRIPGGHMAPLSRQAAQLLCDAQAARDTALTRPSTDPNYRPSDEVRAEYQAVWARVFLGVRTDGRTALAYDADNPVSTDRWCANDRGRWMSGSAGYRVCLAAQT